MIPRLCKPLEKRSFFLFGPRGTGKTSLLKGLFPPDQSHLWFDFLDFSLYQQLLVSPQKFTDMIPKNFGAKHWVIADEIQRLPGLLNYVHKLIEERKINFALTGSSTRKLKRGGANLLAGRALINHLHPFTFYELRDLFNLDHILTWGALPSVVFEKDPLVKKEILLAYVGTYLKEEIKEEQLVRNLDPFARFLEVAAQQNGRIINFSKISRDAMTEVKSVQRYFDILVETLIGFYLPPYHRSVRKAQVQKSKFYFFDLGVKRALEGYLSEPNSRTYSYGEAFEHFFVLECIRLKDYLRLDYQFSYICTKDGLEIDLLIQKSKKELWAVEIKSSDRVDLQEILKKKKLGHDLGVKRFLVASRESISRQHDGIEVMPWQRALGEIFGKPKKV